VDFEPVLDLLPQAAVRVIEVAPTFLAEEIVLGRKRLEALFKDE
jgi:hypothetical protein